MSAEFEELLTTLDADTERMPLPDPRQVRAVGDTRNRRQVVVLAGVVVVVLATLAGVGLAAAAARPAQRAAGPGPGPALTTPVATPSVAATTAPTPAVSTTPAPPSPTPSTSTAPRSGQPCPASALTFVGRTTEGAMGSLYTTYTVRNRGPVMCRLQGAPPLRYRGASGTLVALPGTYDQGGTAVSVASGATAVFVTREVNGLGGYPPGSPQCAHPATYTHVAVVLAGGSTLALGANEKITVQCETLTVHVWQGHA